MSCLDTARVIGQFARTFFAADQRLLEPAEVADLVLWLCGPTAAMVTGASYTMDGGWSAR